MKYAPHALLFILAAALPLVAADAQNGRGAPRGPQPVIVATVEKDRFADTIEALGTLRANETVTLTATVTETVTAVNFEDGQRVEKGDILVEMTSAEEAAALERIRNARNREKQRDRDRGQELD